MTKQDFELIARVLLEQRSRASSVELWRLDETARAFADELAEDNSRFRRHQFLDASGVRS